MHVAAHHSVEQLQALRDHAAKPALVLKLQAVLLARRDWPAPRIAEALGKSVRTIQQWIGSYNRRGLEGLTDRRGGNHRHLTATQEQQIRDHLDAQAQDPQAGVRHAAELIPFIRQSFGVTYSLSGLYDLLHRLGYEWLMPRPRHEKDDPVAAELFLKAPPRRWHASPPSTPTSASRSGSRTRPAWTSRAR